MREVCLTPQSCPSPSLWPAAWDSSQPGLCDALGWSSPGDSWWLFLLLPAQGQPHHRLKQQPEEAARTQGWRGEAGVLLASSPAQLTRTFGSLSGLEEKRHRETRQFRANFFSLPLSHWPALAVRLNSLPWLFQALPHRK